MLDAPQGCTSRQPLLISAQFPRPKAVFPQMEGQSTGPLTADKQPGSLPSLTQISRQNVKDLRLAWKFDGEEEGGLETSPIIVGGILYGYTATQKVIALDGATGKLIWKFDSQVNGKNPVRGLAYWTDGKRGRILASVTNFLYALDWQTGQPIPDFGENGRIDLRKGLGGDYRLLSLALTSPGIVYKDLIIVGGRNPGDAPISSRRHSRF